MPKSKKTKSREVKETKKKAKRRKVWEIRPDDFMKAVEKTLEAGGDKHRLQSEVLAITKPYNVRRSESNCNEDKVMRMLRKMRKETGLDLPLADATKLNADRKKYWIDRLSKYND